MMQRKSFLYKPVFGNISNIDGTPFIVIVVSVSKIVSFLRILLIINFRLRFSKLDDIVINTVNNAAVVNDPFILKTTVREYQILRIMSGMGALAFSD